MKGIPFKNQEVLWLIKQENNLNGIFVPPVNVTLLKKIMKLLSPGLKESSMPNLTLLKTNQNIKYNLRSVVSLISVSSLSMFDTSVST